MSDAHGVPPRSHMDNRILRALRQAVRAALYQHKLAGNPIAVWCDGASYGFRPEDIPEPTDAEEEV